MKTPSSVTESVVRNHVAYITWSVGNELPLGTDTFVVRDGKIVSQTFAMYAPKAA